MISGNTIDGNLPRYEWTLPHFHFDNEPRECIFRIRYNISTNDYPGLGSKTCLNTNSLKISKFIVILVAEVRKLYKFMFTVKKVSDPDVRPIYE